MWLRSDSFFIKLYCKGLAKKCAVTLARFKNLYISLNIYAVKMAILKQKGFALDLYLDYQIYIFVLEPLPHSLHTVKPWAKLILGKQQLSILSRLVSMAGTAPFFLHLFLFSFLHVCCILTHICLHLYIHTLQARICM